MVDTADLESAGRKSVRVRVPPSAPTLYSQDVQDRWRKITTRWALRPLDDVPVGRGSEGEVIWNFPVVWEDPFYTDPSLSTWSISCRCTLFDSSPYLRFKSFEEAIAWLVKTDPDYP